jgi:hypothetical protein
MEKDPMQHLRVYALLALAAAFPAFISGNTAMADPFPANPQNVLTNSLGLIAITVTDPAYQGYLAANGAPPGWNYNASTNTLYSTTLYDPSTMIGTSAPYQQGNVPASVPIGNPTSSTLTSTQIAGLASPFAAPANGTDEVSTQVQSLNMTNGSGTTLSAGSAAPNAAGPSYGQVQSQQQPTTNPNNDFPAKSFFDVFVEINMSLGGFGSVDADLTNTAPLVVQNDNATNFSAGVVAWGSNISSSSVPLYFSNSNGSNWTAGDQFGTLLLGAYGFGFGSTPSAVNTFDQDFIEDEMADGTPLSSADLAGFGIPEPGSCALFATVLAGFVLRRRRRGGGRSS